VEVAEFWRAQDRFEREMGWSTEEHIRSVSEENEEQRRLYELDFALGRCHEEALELFAASAEPDLTGQSPDEYDYSIGEEAVDVMIFSRKGLQALPKEPEEYLAQHQDEELETGGLSRYEELSELLKTDPETYPEDTEDRWYGEIQSYARNITEEFSPETSGNIYNTFKDNHDAELTSYHQEIGHRLSDIMLQSRTILDRLPEEKEYYLEKKQLENEERAEEHSPEDPSFGVGNSGYGKDGLLGLNSEKETAPSAVAVAMYGDRDWF